MRAIYEIMRDSRALIEPLWRMVDDYIELSCAESIEYAMISRAVPEIRVYMLGVTEDLDESLSIVYNFDGQMNVSIWQSMDLISRLSSLRLCTFKYEYTRRFHDVYICEIVNMPTAIELINGMIHGHNWWWHDRYPISPQIKTRFARELFDSHGCKK
jgi:hypothetical protein